MTTTTKPLPFRVWREKRNEWRALLSQVNAAIAYESEPDLADEEVDRRTDLTAPLVKQLLDTRAPSLSALGEKIEIVGKIYSYAAPEAIASLAADVAALEAAA